LTFGGRSCECSPSFTSSFASELTSNVPLLSRCDLFLALIADSVYDARSRVLLERVASKLGLGLLDVVRFEKRVTDSLEIQEGVEKMQQTEVLDARKNMSRNKRYVAIGLATLGSSLPPSPYLLPPVTNSLIAPSSFVSQVVVSSSDSQQVSWLPSSEPLLEELSRPSESLERPGSSLEQEEQQPSRREEFSLVPPSLLEEWLEELSSFERSSSRLCTTRRGSTASSPCLGELLSSRLSSEGHESNSSFASSLADSCLRWTTTFDFRSRHWIR